MSDDPQFINLPLVATFLKHFSRAYLGPANDSHATRVGARTNGDERPNGNSEIAIDITSELVPEETQKAMRDMHVSYFNTASKTLVKGQIVRSSAILTQATLSPSSEIARAGQT